MKLEITRRFFAAATLYLSSITLHAYEVETHKDFTIEAYKASSVNMNRFSDYNWHQKFGFEKSEVFYLVEPDSQLFIDEMPQITIDPITGVFIGGITIDKMIGYGAVLEDSGSRPLQHFLDPQNNNRSAVPFLPNSADWSLEDNDIIPLNQRFSYADLLSYYTGTVHGTSNEVRKRRMALLWQGLGHLVHHIQDMAQPQHVRNDGHCNADQCASWENVTFGFWDLHQPSGYEEYSKLYLTPEKMQALYGASDYFGNGAGFNFVQQGFLSARDFWLKANQGQADFVSKNFVTVDTNYRVADLGGSISDLLFVDIDTHPSYPLPNIDSGSMISSVNRELLTRENICTQQEIVDCEISGEFYFVNHSFVDPVTNSEHFLPRFTSFGLWDDELVKRGDKPIFSLNRLNYRDRYESLVPRAIAFSQGLIDFFFRGEIEVTKVLDLEDTGRYTLFRFTNTSNFPISGQFTSFSENIDGTNRLSRGMSNVSLEPGQSTGNLSISDFFPYDEAFTGNRSVSFRGDIGGSYGVATYHFFEKNDPQLQLCNTTVNANGSSEGHDQIYSLGSAPVSVGIHFEAYQIPDGLNVLAADGSTLASTNGQVSDYHFLEFDFDPASSGGGSVRVIVDGNSNMGTAWELRVACPSDGQEI